MKNTIFIAVAILIAFKWQDIYWSLRPLPDYSNAENQVALYSAEWCGYCDKARKLLTRANVQFTEYDIEKSEKGYYEFKGFGGNGVPLLVVNGKVIGGWVPDKIIEYLVE